MLFQDEFSLSNTATLSATWAEKGRQPLVDCKQVRKEHVTGFGSVNPLTGRPVANFAGAGNAKTFKKHLRRVLWAYRAKRKILIFVDNVRFHHAKALKPFLEAHPELEIRYLPAYSPDLNPVERVW